MSHATNGHTAHGTKKRQRSSLPVSGRALSQTPARVNDDGKRVRSEPRERIVSAQSGQTPRERPSVAMFDKLFTATPLPTSLRARPATEATSHSPVDVKIATPMSTPCIHNPGISPAGFELGNSTFSQFGDDIDEISLLGLAALDYSESRQRHKSPETFLDDISMKMESPANFSIDKLLDEHEPEPVQCVGGTVSLLKQSPGTVDDTVDGILGELLTAAVQTPVPLPIGTTETIFPHGPEMPEDASYIHIGQNKVFNEESPSHNTRHSGPNGGLREYTLESTPKSIPVTTKPHSVQRTPPRKETAFVDSLQVSSQVKGTIEAKGESFASTAVDAEDEHEVPTITAPESQKLDKGQFDITTSKPITNIALHPFDKRQSQMGNVLGSAIRLEPTQEFSPHEVRLPTGAARDSRKTAAFELSTPIMSKIEKLHKVGTSEPRLKTNKPTTPPPRKRYSMDIPLSRPGGTVELWKNRESFVRQRRSPSPPSFRPPIAFIRTPPPKERRAMDVPLSRGDAAEEVWRVGETDSRRRRVLLTPEPTRRTSSALNLMVDESPQNTHSDASPENRSFGSSNRGILGVPKLDFGCKVRHSRTLSDPAEDPVLMTPLQDLDEQANQNEGSEEPEQRNIIDAEVAISEVENQHPEHVMRTRRKCLISQNFTPRSSKLRQLARHLEEDKEAQTESEGLHATNDASETLTPKSLRRKQLSDDINLDFASETIPQVDQSEFEPEPSAAASEDEDTGSTQAHNAAVSPKKVASRGQVAVATPVFTLKRKRPLQETPLPMPETSMSPVQVEREPAKKTKVVHSRGIKAAMAKHLATFGVIPEVLPRSRRERKKPAEFWKIESLSATTEKSLAHMTNARAKQAHKREHSVSVARDLAEESSVTSDQAASSGMKKKKLRPSEFNGPISSHRKIQGSLKVVDKLLSSKTKKVPSHNFEE